MSKKQKGTIIHCRGCKILMTIQEDEEGDFVISFKPPVCHDKCLDYVYRLLERVEGEHSH